MQENLTAIGGSACGEDDSVDLPLPEAPSSLYRTVSTHNKQLFTITPAAAERLKVLMQRAAQEGKTYTGIAVTVKAKGCSGLAYKLEFAKEVLPLWEQIENHGVMIFVDPKAVLYVIGTEMDYVVSDDGLEGGFTFRNPNEKGRCGCGESFHV